MKFVVNIEKRYFYFILIALTVLIGVIVINAYTNPIPNPGHGGDKILINVGGVEKTLQQAIDNGDFSTNIKGISKIIQSDYSILSGTTDVVGSVFMGKHTFCFFNVVGSSEGNDHGWGNPSCQIWGGPEGWTLSSYVDSNNFNMYCRAKCLDFVLSNGSILSAPGWS